VAKLGSGVTGFRIGERVMGRCTAPSPNTPSWTRARRSSCRTICPGRRRDPSARFHGGARHAVAQGRLKAGEWLLVTGISAGVGVAALQTGKALGAKVIGTSGSPRS